MSGSQQIVFAELMHPEEDLSICPHFPVRSYLNPLHPASRKSAFARSTEGGGNCKAFPGWHSVAA